MVNLIDFFKSIAHDLGDDEPNHEFTRYTRESMLDAYNQGMCLVAMYRPDIFTSIKVIKLNAGEYFNLKGCCGNVLEVLDQTDANGNTIKSLTNNKTTKSKAANNWKKTSCLRKTAGFEVNYVNIDEIMNSTIKVSPPIPCGESIYVRVKCSSPPCNISEASLLTNSTVANSCNHITAVRHYIMGRMLAGDRHSTSNYNAAQLEYKMFFNILEIEMRNEMNLDNEVRK